MAGDWIKMRSNLWDDPRVTRMVDVTDSSEASVIGALYWLWATADQHSSEGWMPGLTLRQIDRKTGVPGMGEALKTVGWVEVGEDGITLARFTEHNGASAKSRGETARRVQEHRKRTGNEKVVTDQVQVRYLEKEKEKEKEVKAKATVQQAAPQEVDGLPEDIGKPDGPGAPVEPKPQRAAPRKAQTAKHFPAFWAAYPVKKGKAAAEKHWKAKGCDEFADTIVDHVRLMEGQDDQWRRGFIPHGSTYICGEHWTDEPQKDKDAVHTTTPAPPPESFGPAAVEKRTNTETKLERQVAYIRHQHSLGAYGEGDAATAERDRLIAEATDKFRSE